MKEKVFVSDLLDRPGGLKFALMILCFDGLAMLFDGFDFMIVSFTMPQIMQEMELGLFATGALPSFSLIGMLLGGFIAGWLADRYGRRHVLNVSIMIYAAFTIPVFFVHSFDAFAVCRILSGIGIGAVIPLSVTIASEYAPTKYRGIFVTASKMFMILGWVIAGLVAMFIVPNLGWRWCYLIGGFPFIYGILMYLLMPESVQWLLRKGKSDKALKIVNRINQTLNEPRPEPYTIDDLELKPVKPKSQVGALLSPKYRRVTIGIWIVAFTTCALSYGLTNWMPTILTMRGYSIAQGYGLTTLMNALGAFGALFAGFMADRIGRLNSTYLAVGLAILATLFMVFFGFGLGWMIPACILMGFTINYAYITPQPITVEAYPTEIRATGQACVTTVARIGGLIVPIAIGGAMQSGSTFEIVALFFIAPLIIAAICTRVLIKRETKDQTIEEIDDVGTNEAFS